MNDVDCNECRKHLICHKRNNPTKNCFKPFDENKLPNPTFGDFYMNAKLK